ncbi:MAG: hypothetical protein JWL81_954, partial [Verrucomicrobiales bacterium]|nr:hypothetical protein [Verrucomicrobiales bacterium]
MSSVSYPFRLMSWLIAGLGFLFLLPVPGYTDTRFQSLPEKLAENQWRLTWTTESGQRYLLQRSPDLSRWDTVAEIQAEAAVTSFTDAGVPALQPQTFWRAIRLGGPDTSPPVVSILQIRRLSSDGQTLLELTVQAEDNVGVVGVGYREGAVQLGAATQGPAGTWKRVVPLDPGNSNPRQFQAVASDAAGNTGFSDIFTFIPTIQSQDLIPLDRNGQPLGDSLVGLKPDGTLNPFTYLPDLNGGGSTTHAMRIDFPDGGNLVAGNGGPFVEGRRMVVGFGEGSPTQFIQFTTGLPGPLTLQAPPGQTLRVPRGPLSYQTLATLLGVPPTGGIALQVHGKSEVLWTGGTLTRTGIRGGTFRLLKPAMTLPGVMGGYEKETVDLTRPDPIGFSIHGSMRLGKLAQLTIPRARPLSLHLLPGGGVTLTGSADLLFDDGARFNVEVFLDDPVYSLSLRAGNVEVPLMGSLADLLPDDPASCIPGGSDKVALDHAAACLEAHARAYRFFIAAARGLRPDGPGDAVVQSVPDAVDLTGAALEAWATLRAADLTNSLPLQEIQQKVESLSRQTRGGGSTPVETIQAVAQLTNLRRTIAPLNAADLTTQARDAILAAKPALLKALEDPAVLSRDALGTIVLTLSTGEFDFDTELSAAAASLLARAVQREASAVGVVAGVTDSAANPVLSAQNPYVVRATLRRLADIESAAQNAAISVLELPLFNECFQQIFDHGYTTCLTSLNKALDERNPLGAMVFVGELQDIQSFEQLSAVEILASPSNSTLQTIITRASTLMEQAIGASPQTDPDNPVTRDQVFATARQLESVMELAARIPNGDPLVQSVASLAFQRLESLLPDAVSPTALAAVDNEDELLLYLDAGILHTKLKRRFPSFTGSFNWEGPPVGNVAAQLADIAITTGDSALISKVSRRLLDTAGDLENLALERPSDAVALRFARKRYLIVAADTLADLHPLSIIEWNATESRRGTGPASVSADGFLPGDLKIDRLFGAVKHNRLSGKTEGRFGGQLRLPKLNSALTIHGASIDSDGRFDLTASGALRLPGTPDAPIVSLTIPRSQPLHLALAPGQAPVMEGRARLAFDNGASVGVGLRFADPIYTFQAEAGGLQTGLRDALLAVQSPQVGSLNLSPLWADYYDSLGTWLEGFEGTDEPSGAGEADDFPAYPGHVPGDVTSLLQAWLARALAEVQAGGSSFIVGSNDVFRSSLDRFASGLTDLADSFNELFPPSAEARAQDLLKQLKGVAEIQKQMAELLDKMARSNLNGGSYNPAALQPFFQAANAVVDEAVQTLRENPALLARPDLVKTVSKAALDNAAARQLAGENSTAQLEAAKDLLREGTNAYNASKGLLPNGTVDSAILGALSATEIEETLREFMNMHSLLLLAGDTGGPNAVHLSRMAEEFARATLDEVGFVAVSGLVDDSGPDERLLAAIRRLHMVYVDINPLLNAPLPVPSSLTFTAFLLHNECMDRSKRLARDEWYQRYQLLTGASLCRALRLAAGGQPLEDVDIAREDQIMLQAFAQQGTGRLDPEEVELMRVLEERRSTPQVAAIFNSRILEAASQLFTATTPPWVSDDVAQGKILLEEIAELDRLAGGAFPFAAQRDPASLLARVRQRMAESSAAARKTTPPAVVARLALEMADPAVEDIQVRNLLGPQSTAIRDAVDPGTKPVSQTPAFENALRAESAGLLNASRAVLADRADDVRPPVEPDLALPGNLVVDRVFGGFFFNRLTGFFRGNFGGKLLFPDPRASFEIVEAVFDSTGAFNITAGTGLPVKVMGNDRSTLTATLSVAGSPLGLQSVGGTGSLTVPFGPDQPGNPGTRSYNGTFSYQPDQPGKPLTFTAAVDGVQNEFKLGNDFALFDGQVALTFATAQPELTLQLGGRAGFFARVGAPPALGVEGKFWVVCAIDELALAVTPDKLRATFDGGSLKLAQDLFQSDLPGGDGFVRFDLAGTLGVDYSIPTGGLNFFGNNNPAEPFRVAGSDFRFRVPGIADSLITVDTCALEFFQNRFPVLTELDASFRFPLPGLNAADPSQRVPEFGLNVQGWGVDGFPPDAATITLNNGLSLMDLDGLDIELLGQNVGAFPPVALTLLQVEEGGQTFTRMELEGGMRVGIDSGLITPRPGTNPTSPQVLTTNSGSMRTTVAGDFGWTFKPGARPAISLEEILIEGNFLLGGSLEISGVNGPTASLRIRGFADLFVRNDPADPFSIELGAAVGFANIGKFQLQGARFVWRDPASGIPDFDVAGAGAVLGDSLSTLLGDGMPVYMKSVFLEFLQTAGRPLIGSPGNPGRFDLDNIRLTLTAGAEFPPSPPIQIDGETPELDELPPSGPRFGGEITNLRVSFPSGNPLLPDFQLDSVRMGIQGLDIPPLKGLTGQVALLNLDQLRADPPRPDRVTFAGELGADFNGTGVSVLLAASPSQLHGAALTASIPGGIPLDGGVLGGILWNGASGGIHFKNSFEDPTEFKTFLTRDGSGNFTGANEFPPPGNPGTNASNVEDPLEEVGIANGEDSIYVKPDLPPAPGQQFDPFDVLQDNWPPQAANPLLEEFPAGSGRLVFKGSRMTAGAADSFLNSIGVIPGDTRTAEQIIQVFLTNITVGLRTEADNAVNALLTVSQMQGNAGIRSHYQALTNRLIDSFDDIVRPILRGILQPVGLAGGPSVRQQMHDLLTNGIPGFNVTFLGSGTFTHTAVAPVMDLKGTISASTTGAALSRGELRVAGIPVAEASLGLSLTNQSGKISPFFGGLARVGIGPLQMGKVTMSAKFPDAAAIVTHFDQYLQCTTSALSVAAAGQFRLLAENAIGAQVPAGTSLQAFLLARTDAEKIAVTGALFEYFAQSAKGTLGSQFVLAQQDFNTLLNCFATFVSNSLNSLTPELGFGGKIEPSIFDIPMTTSGMPLASARMRYGPVLRAPTGNESPVNDLLANPSAFLDSSAPPGVREFSAYLQFSPSAMLLAPITGTFVAINPTNAAFAGFTALDFAEFGFSFQQTAWTPEKVMLFLTNPVQHYANTTDEFFNTAVFAAGYQLSPFGMDLADGQLRLVFPDTQLHPLRPGGSNISRRNNPIVPINSSGVRTLPLPTTDEVILAALTAGKIKDATYRGRPGELAELFPVP